MARALKFGLSVSWPILAAMFGQTWIASRWVNQMENSLVSVQKEIEAARVQSDIRLSRLENTLYFNNKKN